MSDYYPEPGADDDRNPPYYEEDERTPLWRRPLFLGAVTAAVVVVALVVFAYRSGVETGENQLPPLVQAQPGPAKVAPEDPGGLEVPHRDKLIYDRMAGKNPADADGVEQLLPGPEEPVPESQLRRVEQNAARPTTPGPAPSASAGSTQSGAPASGAEESDSATTNAEVAPGAAGRPAGPNAPPQIGPRFSDLLKHTPKAEAPQAGEQVAALEPPPATQPAGAAGAYFVQLGSLRSEAGAQTEWDRLTRKMPDLLANRHPVARRADLGTKGVFYRLQTGPFPDKTAAADWCDRVKALGQGCIVVSP